MIKTRKDINALDKNLLADYVHALTILRARSTANPNDETGYDFQASLHNDVFIGPCEHGNDLFFAWHRAHLHYFERLLQEADPPRTANVTIPYWDWIHPELNGKFPAAFSEPGLYMPGRNNNSTLLPPDTLKIITEEVDWNAFGGYPNGDPRGDYGRLEFGPHNLMHGFFIGGRMGDPSTAAEDAIYWSFHAFIDLLWAEWQRRNGTPSPTSPNADLRGFLTKPRHKVSDFQKTTDLDYEYEYNDKLKAAFGVSKPEQVRSELLTTTTLEPLFADGLEVELRRASSAQFGLDSPSIIITNAIVRLQNLKVPTKGSYMLRAYVHPKKVPFVKDDTEFERMYGVGYVALWKSHEENHTHDGHEGHDHHTPKPHHPTSCTVRFDVSVSLAASNTEAASELVFTLYYIPAPNSSGEPQTDPSLIEEVQLEKILLEAYR